MSYIKNTLENVQENSETSITRFLIKEGFKFGTGPQGSGKMYYVASGSYTVWFTLFDSYFGLYAEYDCGGKVGSTKYPFTKNNMNSFMKAYKKAIDWANDYM